MIKVNLKSFIDVERECMVSEGCKVEDIKRFDELLNEEMEYKEFLINFGKYWGELVCEYGDSDVIFNILLDNIKNGNLGLEEGCEVWLEYWDEVDEEDREERKETFIEMIEIYSNKNK